MADIKYFKSTITKNYYGSPKVIKGSVFTGTEIKKIYSPTIIVGCFEEVAESVYKEAMTLKQKAEMSDSDKLKAEITESLTKEFEAKFKLKDNEIKKLKGELAKKKK